MSGEIINRMKKVYELSVRGEAGEKTLAEKMLKQLVKKYGISIDDLVDDEIGKATFKYWYTWEKNCCFKLLTK